MKLIDMSSNTEFTNSCDERIENDKEDVYPKILTPKNLKNIKKNIGQKLQSIKELRLIQNLLMMKNWLKGHMLIRRLVIETNGLEDKNLEKS